MNLFARFGSPILTGIAWLALACAVVMVSGCATSSPVQQVGYALIVQQSTSRFIEHKRTDAERSVRAQEIIRVAELLKAAAGGEEVTVAELQARALELAKARLTEISDVALAQALITAVGDGLKQQVSDGVLNPETRVRVVAVLDQITGTAALYVR